MPKDFLSEKLVFLENLPHNIIEGGVKNVFWQNGLGRGGGTADCAEKTGGNPWHLRLNTEGRNEGLRDGFGLNCQFILITQNHAERLI
jgi:hypothetical protein